MSLQAIEFDLQITPGSVPPILHMSQYDSGRQYTAYLKDETNTAFIPGTGAIAKIKGFNAAGVPWELAATVDGSTVVFTPSGAATDQFGVMPVTIEITVGSEKLTPLLMVFDIQKSGYTNEEAVRSPEFQTALVAAVAAAIEEGGLGFSEEFKEALLTCMAHVAWSDTHGQDYYDALEDVLYPPVPVTLLSITADYQQDHTIYDTDPLDAIKVSDDLTVTANYSDGSSVVLDDDDYTLSGTLTVGTSTITAAYGGKTATFNVTVTAAPLLPPEYQQVEWIQSDGNQVIDTGAGITTGHNMDVAKFEILCDAAVPVSNSSTAIIMSKGQQSGFWLGNVNAGADIGIGNAYVFTDIDITERHTFKMHWTAASASSFTGYAVCGEQELSRSGTNIDPDRAFTFFADALRAYPAKCRIFYGEVRENNTAIRKMYPCYRISDNVIGMYDIVNDVFYTNGGTGTFTKGNNV